MIDLATLSLPPATLMEGVLSMILATQVALVATVGDIGMFGMSAGSAVIAFAAVSALWLSSSLEHQHVWEAVGDTHSEEKSEQRQTVAQSAGFPSTQAYAPY